MKREKYEQRKAFAGDKQPSMLRRRLDHDYTGKRIYLITMTTEGRQPLLGTVVGAPLCRLCLPGARQSCPAASYTPVAGPRLAPLQSDPDSRGGGAPPRSRPIRGGAGLAFHLARRESGHARSLRCAPPPHVLVENGFTPLTKPKGEQFEACSEGRLLLLAPWPHHNEKRKITASQCQALNLMATAICR